MFLTIAKIFVVVLAILAVSKSYISYREKKESLAMVIFWTFSWVVINVVAFSPAAVGFLLNDLGGRAGIGTILGLGMVFIYFIVYRVYVKADRIEKQLNKVIRYSAINTHRRKSRSR